jgi:ADP-heptose:LPS heptosyltransferase
LRNLEKFFGSIFLNVLKLSILRQDISPESIDHHGIKNILVIIRHQMGDMLLTTPMLRSLRLQYPEAKITLVTKNSTKFSEVFKNDNSLADEVMEYESGFENFVNLVKELRDKKFDLAVVPSTVVFSVTNHLIAYYSRAKIRVGAASINFLDNKADFLLNLKSDFLWDSKKVHFIERNLDIIRQLGFEPKAKKINISLQKENTDYAEKFFEENFFEENFPDKSKPVIGIHPGAAKEANVWAPGKFAELVLRLSQKFNSHIFISEGPVDAEYVNRVSELLENRNISGTFKRNHSVLMNNAAIIERLQLFITNDTGVMHLASGLKTPVIALFGPTKAYEWGPLGEGKVSIQSSTSNINDISVDKVFEVCWEILGNKVEIKKT